MKKFKTKKLIYSSFIILFILSIIILKIIYDNSSYSNILWLRTNSIIGWIALVISIITWKKIRHELVSLYIIYLILLYFFTYGQTLLIVYNLVDESKDLLLRFSSTEIINMQFFTLLSLLAFHFGALLFCKKPNTNNSNIYNYVFEKDSYNSKDRKFIMLKAIEYGGLILLVFSVPGFIYDTINTLNTVIQGGYGAIYGYHTGGVAGQRILLRIFEQTGEYFIPALICLLIAYKSHSIKRRLIFSLLILRILNGLYIGGRGGAVVLVLVLIMASHYTVRTLNKRKLVKIGIFSYFFVSFLSIVGQMRGAANKGGLDYFIAFIESFGKENLFFRTLSELGWTMFPLGAVMRIVPDQYSFLYGKSYFYALTSIIPNLGFWDIHPAKVYAGGGQWLMGTLNLWSGPGFTLIADAYRNFEWVGFIVLIGFGIFFGRVYSSIDKNSINVKPESVCMVLITFATTVMSVRGDNLYIVRPLVYIVIPIYMLIRIIYNKIIK